MNEKGQWVVITSDHMRLAKEITKTLREQLEPRDALSVACCMIAVIATMATEPVNVIENAVATLAQVSPKLRGPLINAVLEELANQLEPDDGRSG